MTITQKQCLLLYLGYYTGKVDGIWGPKSKAATENFQKAAGLEVSGDFDDITAKKIVEAIGGACQAEEDVQSVNLWEGIKYFKREEFRCKCGRFCNGYPVEPVRVLLEAADDVREYFGAPAYVSSGIRCEQHNAYVGGVVNSRHKLGKAMDFRVEGKTASEVLRFVSGHPDIRYAYDIDGTYVHMDVY